MTVARRAHAYPSIEIGAAALVDTRVAVARAGATVDEAIRLARRRDAGLVSVGRACHVLREDLARASAIGLDALPAEALARPVPVVGPRESEARVRRHLLAGAAAVAVVDPRGPLGAVADAEGWRRPTTGVSLASRLSQRLPEAARALLDRVAEIARAHGTRAFLVGGLVRDAWGAVRLEAREFDVVVEGDGPALARALAAATGGSVVEHRRFLTASVRTGDHRVDIATSRAERYEAPGALPRVMPAGIAQDLGRRDFTVNAMAVELDSGRFELLDPFGGRVDLERKRLRALHPLSFVEDPTRIFRAARYAARLGLREDAWTVRARTLALARVPYAALSPQRVASELTRVMAEDRAHVALRRLGMAGAFRLLDPRYRFTAATRRCAEALPAAFDWARVRGLAPSRFELAVLALVTDQAPEVRLAALRGVALTGDPLGRLVRTAAEWQALARALAAARASSEAARLLRGRGASEIAWLWLGGDAALRARLDAVLERERQAEASLSGEEVIALGVPRGPAVGRALEAVRDARLDGTVTDRAAEVDYVRRWAAQSGHGAVTTMRKEG